ncbi:MAG TPA: hypothetical protein VMF65_01190 [Acidimicrobiales bacterium]|nr:hypothetical protein [Acidimicrobiales bacterium]
MVVNTVSPPSAFWQKLAERATALPGFFDILWRTGLWVMTGWGLFLLGASLLGSRLDILRDQVLALVGSGVGVIVVEAAVGGTSRSLWGGTVAGGPPADAVSARLGFAVAAVATVSPLSGPAKPRPQLVVDRCWPRLRCVSRGRHSQRSGAGFAVRH